MRQTSIEHEFVDVVPDELEKGKLYVSIRYRTASHLCACGCGSKIVTPIKPPKWHLIFDGETVTLKPSIGNWQLPCRSHYWIDRGTIRWAKQWTEGEIFTGRERDASDVRRYYADRQASTESAVTDPRPGLLVRLRRRIRRK